MHRTVTIPKENEIMNESNSFLSDELDVTRETVESNDESGMKAKSTRPRRKKDKNLQVSKDKVPSPGDSTSYISSWLMLHNKAITDIEFSRKACESLVKKLKDKNTDTLLNTLIKAVATDGREADQCIPIGRTLDGRLQVASRKGLPHLIYVRIFRNSEAKKTDLRHLPVCQYAYDMKQEQYVCVNPWHYEKIVTSIRFQSMTAEKQEEKEITKSRESIKTPSKSSSFSSDQTPVSISSQTTFDPAQPSIPNYISLNPTTQLTYTNLADRYELEGNYQSSLTNIKKTHSEQSKQPEVDSYSNIGIFLPNYAAPTNMMSAAAKHFDPFDSAVAKSSFPQFTSIASVNNESLNALARSAFTTINGSKKSDVNSSLPNLYSADASNVNVHMYEPPMTRKTSVGELYSREKLLPTSFEKAPGLLNYNQMIPTKSHTTITNSTFMGSNDTQVENADKNGIITVERLFNNMLPSLRPESFQVDASSSIQEQAKELEYSKHVAKVFKPRTGMGAINVIEQISSDDEDYSVKRDTPVSRTTEAKSSIKERDDDSTDKSVIGMFNQATGMEGAKKIIQENVVADNLYIRTDDKKRMSIDAGEEQCYEESEDDLYEDNERKKQGRVMKEKLERKFQKVLSLCNSIISKDGKKISPTTTVEQGEEETLDEFPSDTILRIMDKSDNGKKKLLMKYLKKKRKTHEKALVVMQKVKKQKFFKIKRMVRRKRSNMSKFTTGFIEKRRKLASFSNRVSKYIPGIDSFKALVQQPRCSRTSALEEEQTRLTSLPTFSRSRPSTSHSGQQADQLLTQSVSLQEHSAIRTFQQSDFNIGSMDSQVDKGVDELADDTDPVVIEPVENYDITQVEKNMLALSCVSNCIKALREQNILPKTGEKTGNELLDFFNNHSDILLFDSQNAWRNPHYLTNKKSLYFPQGQISEDYAERLDWFRTELWIIDSSLKKRWQEERKNAHGTTQRLKMENDGSHMWNIHLAKEISKEVIHIKGKKKRAGRNQYEQWATFKYLQNGNVIEIKDAIYNAMFMGVSFSRIESASQIENSSCRWKGICGLCVFWGVDDSVWLKNYSCCAILVNVPPSITTQQSKRPFKVYPGSQLKIFQRKKQRNESKSQCSENSQSTESIMNTGEVKISYLPGNGQCAHSDDQIHIQITM